MKGLQLVRLSLCVLAIDFVPPKLFTWFCVRKVVLCCNFLTDMLYLLVLVIACLSDVPQVCPRPPCPAAKATRVTKVGCSPVPDRNKDPLTAAIEAAQNDPYLKQAQKVRLNLKPYEAPPPGLGLNGPTPTTPSGLRFEPSFDDRVMKADLLPSVTRRKT